MVDGAHRADLRQYQRSARQLSRSEVDNVACTRYLFMMLVRVILDRYGPQPSYEAVSQLAAASHADWSKILNPGRERLVDTLLFASRLISSDEAIRRSVSIECFAVTLGVLLDEPRHELDELRIRVGALRGDTNGVR